MAVHTPTLNDPTLRPGLFVPRIVAIFFGAILTGVILDQVVNFVRPSQGKAPPRRFDTIIVALLSAGTVVFCGLDLWSLYRLTYQYGLDLDYVYHWHTLDFASALLVSLITATAQVWFMERCWRVVKKSPWFICLVGPLWLLAIAMGIAFFCLGMATVGQVKFFKMRTDLLVTYAWAGLAVDMINTIVLCYRVRQLRSINRSSRAGDVFLLAFTTGMLTSVWCLITGALYHRYWRTTNAFCPFLVTLPRLFTISVLVTIAHRRTLQGRMLGMQTTEGRRGQKEGNVTTPSGQACYTFENSVLCRDSHRHGGPRPHSTAPTGGVQAIRLTAADEIGEENYDEGSDARDWRRQRRENFRWLARLRQQRHLTNAARRPAAGVIDPNESAAAVRSMARTQASGVEGETRSFASAAGHFMKRWLAGSAAIAGRPDDEVEVSSSSFGSPASDEKAVDSASKSHLTYDDEQHDHHHVVVLPTLQRPKATSRHQTSDGTMVDMSNRGSPSGPDGLGLDSSHEFEYFSPVSGSTTGVAATLASARQRPEPTSRTTTRSAHVSEVGSAAALDRALASYASYNQETRDNGSEDDEADDLARSRIGVSPRTVVVVEDTRRARRASGIVVTTHVTVQPEE